VLCVPGEGGDVLLHAIFMLRLVRLFRVFNMVCVSLFLLSKPYSSHPRGRARFPQGPDSLKCMELFIRIHPRC